LPLFRFEFRSEAEYVPDPMGTHLPGLRAAHLHAVQLIARTVRFLPDVPSWRSWRVVVTDHGSTLLTVLFPLRVTKDERRIDGRA
jgi:hypothetical protein